MEDTATSAEIRSPEGYTIERELGRGGMATVYLARDGKHDRLVALKLMRPELAMSLGEERFQREIRLAGRLQHPHIVPVFDSGQTGGRLWYAMPFVEGESLRARMRREGPLTIDEALQIAREVADALGCAHAHGIVHRDIKPENILLSGGHALVADFGIARVVNEAGGERLTETGLGVGTPGYMSPEQSLGEREVDGRTDLYALAAVLYEMLAGEPPFTGPNAQAIVAKRLSQPAPRVRTLRETVPEEVEAALIRALAREPADRFKDAGEFVAALSTPLPLRSPASAPTRQARGRLRRAAFACALPVVAVAGWYLWQLRPAVPPAASVVAVFPLVSAAPDTALTRLGRDLASTVSASLDGVGELRTVDRLTVLAQAPEGSPAPPLAQAAVVGRRLGATSVIHGTLAREGELVRLDAGLYTSDSLDPLARVEIRARPESLSALTDSLTRKLLVDIWRRGSPPTPTLEAALATRSLPALREYLDGERHLVAGHYARARAAYSRAIAADSSFWFAYYRYGNAMGWTEADVDPAIERAYRDHRQFLPERERLILESGDSGLRRAQGKLREIVRRYPDYWPAWWMLADGLLHYYPYFGSSRAEALAALKQVVTLNPSMVYAWQHLGLAAWGNEDTTTLALVLQNLDRLDARATFVQNEKTDHVLHLRLALQLLRDTLAARPTLDTVYQKVVAGTEDPFFPLHALVWSGRGDMQIGFDRRLLRHGLPPDAARSAAEGIAITWTSRGGWDSALVSRDRLAPSADDTLWTLDSYRLAVLGAWVGGLAPQTAARYRSDAVRLAVAQSSDFRAELAWLDGVLAVAANDSGGLAAARKALGGAGGEGVPLLDRSLGAFEAARRGDTRAAARAMAALEWQSTDRYVWGVDGHPMLRGVDRMAAAEWLIATGDSAEAVRLLRWQEAGSGPWDDKVSLGPLVYLLQARIADGHRDTVTARRYYERFLTRYDAPVPALRHLVIEAREALGRLSGVPAPPAER
jgi:TolB-like protein